MAPLQLRLRPSWTPLCRQMRLLPRNRLPQRRVASTTPPATAASATPPAAPLSASTPGTHGLAGSQPVSRVRTVLLVTSVGLTLFAGYLYATDTRAGVHRWLVPRMIRVLYPDAEDAHHIGTQALKLLYKLGLNPRDRTDRDDPASSPNGVLLATTVFSSPPSSTGMSLTNPIGISAGLDKNADIPDALFALGAAVVEVGGCTPRPQEGNPRPRAFRVPALEGLVNRYGLNSIGADALASRLRARVRAFCRDHRVDEADVLAGTAGVPPGSLAPGRMLLVQVAKNKETDEHNVAAVTDDYTYCVRRLAPYADVLVVNVSSPNTPGLRDLQAVEPLTQILSAVVQEARRTTSSAAVGRAVPPRVLVKVSPDEDEESQVEGICEAIWASGVDGVIVGNTTKRRTGLVPGQLRLPSDQQRALNETGGYSGPAMFGRTLSLVSRYRKRLDQQALQLSKNSDTDTDANSNISAVARKTIFASGGVTTGQDAQKLLNAGADVTMVYTQLVYGGSGTVTRIKQELCEEMKA